MFVRMRIACPKWLTAHKRPTIATSPPSRQPDKEVGNIDLIQQSRLFRILLTVVQGGATKRGSDR